MKTSRKSVLFRISKFMLLTDEMNIDVEKEFLHTYLVKELGKKNKLGYFKKTVLDSEWIEPRVVVARINDKDVVLINVLLKLDLAYYIFFTIIYFSSIVFLYSHPPNSLTDANVIAFLLYAFIISLQYIKSKNELHIIKDSLKTISSDQTN